MRSGVVSAVIAATAMLAVACSSSSDSSAEPSPSASPTTSAADAAALRGAPQIGTCWDIPPQGFTAGHLFNASPAVACTEPHTAETVFVQKVAKPTVQAADQWNDQCARAVSEYVGLQVGQWVPVSQLTWLPPKKQVAAGASWVRCDVGFAHDWGDSLGTYAGRAFEQTVLTHSIKDAVVDNDPALEACLARDPRIRDQLFVPCSKPHMYEETEGFANLETLDAYPPPNQLRRASAQCRYSLPAKEQTPAFEVTAGWPPAKAFPGYIAELSGACFVYRQDGTPLPPLT